MTSIRDRDAGQDFEGNGPSSFGDREPRRFDISDMDLSPRIPGAEKAVAEAIAQVERAMEAERRQLAQSRALKQARAA